MLERLVSLLDWIYKKKCYFCKSSKECVKMCSRCYAELEHLSPTVNRIVYSKNVFCAGVYSKNLQKLIRGLKYHNQPDLAYYLAKFMYEYWVQLTNADDYQIVPVPIYYTRLRKRKYNHMQLVAEEFSKLSGYPVNSGLILRVKDTRPQYKLKRAERLENLKNAFKVDISQLDRRRKILILDDICTTGSTFEEMIKEFEKNNIYDITCFAATTPFED